MTIQNSINIRKRFNVNTTILNNRDIRQLWRGIGPINMTNDNKINEIKKIMKRNKKDIAAEVKKVITQVMRRENVFEQYKGIYFMRMLERDMKTITSLFSDFNINKNKNNLINPIEEANPTLVNAMGNSKSRKVQISIPINLTSIVGSIERNQLASNHRIQAVRELVDMTQRLIDNSAKVHNSLALRGFRDTFPILELIKKVKSEKMKYMDAPTFQKYRAFITMINRLITKILANR